MINPYDKAPLTNDYWCAVHHLAEKMRLYHPVSIEEIISAHVEKAFFMPRR